MCVLGWRWPWRAAKSLLPSPLVTVPAIVDSSIFVLRAIKNRALQEFTKSVKSESMCEWEKGGERSAEGPAYLTSGACSVSGGWTGGRFSQNLSIY